MSMSGLFITLYDEETLRLYLDRGIYGFLMPPIHGEVSWRSRHYHALADYACVREGTHIFFFLKRQIVYGGQASGSNRFGSFYINGPYSPLGKNLSAKIYWDESIRGKYQSTDKPGIFKIPKIEGEYCQPFLIRFNDKCGLKGQVISSDDLYWELGQYPFPLPSNTITGMGFCTLTPGEVEIALNLLKQSSRDPYSGKSKEAISLTEEPLPFKPEYSFNNIKEAFNKSLLVSEAYLEAFVLANPGLLPAELQPGVNDPLCRQVPMCPYKPPKYLDKANICYYSEPPIKSGTLPNTIIELKIKPVGKNEVEQVIKYLKWLYRILDNQAEQVRVYLLGPSIAAGIEKEIPQEYRKQVKIAEF